MAIDYNSGISSLQTGAPDIKYTGDQGPKSPDQQLMASADPMLVEEYQKYVFEMEEQGRQPMSFREFVQQVMSGMAYGGTAKPTYTQSRKQRMAYGGIAGLDGRKKYGIGSWFQEKIMDPVKKVIPNEIKDNPVLSTALLGGALNQWGIPGISGDVGETWGQNWIGELLGNVPGVQGGTVDTVLGGGGGGQSIMDIFRPETISKNPVGGLDQLAKDIIRSQGGDYTGDWLSGITGVIDYGSKGDWTLPDFEKEDIPYEKGTLKDYLTKTFGDTAKQEAAKVLQEKTGINLNNQQEQQDTTQRSLSDILFGPTKVGNQQVQWKIPMQIGAAAGLAQSKMPKANLPQDTSGIDIANIRSRALTGSDPGLHFLPPASATTAYAQGGRIGYAGGSGSDDETETYQNNVKWLIEMGFSPEEAHTMAAFERDKVGKAQGGRIGAQEGGLMNLGGMEKDYRQEGGFVPIGGQEKADDVPARLSKNEFVFTADAVRAAGGGDIDAGAEVMENLMNNLEQGGQVSEDSQGLEGARDMFATSQRLEGVM